VLEDGTAAAAWVADDAMAFVDAEPAEPATLHSSRLAAHAVARILQNAAMQQSK
jgi:hypothetical protein